MKKKPSSKSVKAPSSMNEDCSDPQDLKKQLEEFRLREQYYLTLIETAEQELKIDIRKKSFTK